MLLLDVEEEISVRLFGHSGVIYHDGERKSAYHVWKRWLDKPRVEPPLSMNGFCYNGK